MRLVFFLNAALIWPLNSSENPAQGSAWRCGMPGGLVGPQGTPEGCWQPSLSGWERVGSSVMRLPRSLMEAVLEGCVVFLPLAFFINTLHLTPPFRSSWKQLRCLFKYTYQVFPSFCPCFTSPFIPGCTCPPCVAGQK